MTVCVGEVTAPAAVTPESEIDCIPVVVKAKLHGLPVVLTDVLPLVNIDGDLIVNEDEAVLIGS